MGASQERLRRVGLTSIVRCVVFSTRYVFNRPRVPEGWLLLSASVYDHIVYAGRNSIGLALAMLLMFPSIRFKVRWGVTAFWVIPTLAWQVPVLRWVPWLSTV